MLPDQKKITQMILAKKDESGKESQVEGRIESGIDDATEAKRAIGEDIMHAMKAGSATDLATAIEALIMNLQGGD